ncbi:hypothetical protein VNO78_01974 [Psophocarpus tetragonolobus]|uniref:Uncharacterized protein n=1 Tax=Psophocarpus tetragonolobus TaxID=3891 RepID=A0AAN9XVS8_PSOTE
MVEYWYLLLDLEECYKNQNNLLAAKKAIRKEWRLQVEESSDLQRDLNEVEAPIPHLTAIQTWQQFNLSYQHMEQTLLRIKAENNIMAIRRVRYGMLKVCQRFLLANRQQLSLIEEQNILCTPQWLSNSDEE